MRLSRLNQLLAAVVLLGGVSLTTEARAEATEIPGFCAFCTAVEQCDAQTAEDECSAREGCSTGMAECGALGNCPTLIVCNV
jgi:hypothetical protein